jgi:PAS domain S-box-containing protein
MKARRKDGSEFPAEFSLAGIQHGSVWHAVGVVRDVSERKFHENEQFANLQFLRTVLETIPSPLYYEDMEGYIRGCNRAFEKFVGLSSVSVLGRKTAELLSGAVEDQVRELEPSFLVLPDALETSFHMNLADGRVCHALFRKAPFWDGDGHPQGYVATLLDITELKASEEALRRNQSLFTAIHRHVVDLVAIIDADGHRLYTSPSYQFILGYEEQEMARLSSTDLLHPEDAQRVSQALIGIMEGRPTQRLEYRLRHKDGRWLHFESTAAIIPDAEGGPMRALVVARDITERKASEMNQAAMEVQLRQAQKLEAIGQLAAGIAHEINTPTQFIGDNITFLRDAFRDTFDLVEKVASHLGTGSEAAAQLPPDPRAALAELEASDLAYLREEIPKAIRQSLEGVERISKIVKAMKDFSHPGGASLTLTDLHQAIESTITVSRNEWKYGAELVTDFAPDIPPVPCFPGEFNQVMLNLIVNAAHAIESAREGKAPDFKGQIRIKTHLAKDEVVITVSDNGTGIPEAVQSRMFEPFYTTKPVGKGSGQGLAIAHAVIVEKHRGRIEVESSVGQGTSFILHLPLNTSEQGEGIP